MKNLILLFSLLLLWGCGESTNTDSSKEFKESSSNTEYGSSYEDLESEEEGEDYPDDTYSATVEYYNPDTDFSNTYYLDVEVYDNHVTVIHFDDGGWLDEDQFDAAELDDSGCADITDFEGREFYVCLD